MSILFRADVRRIIRKPILWIFLTVILIMTLISTMTFYVMKQLDGSHFIMSVSLPGALYVMVGSVILLSVYGDEFRSMAMTTVIGHGFSRTKVILTKFLVSVFIIFFMQTLFMLWNLLLAGILKAGLSPMELKAILCFCAVNIYKMTAYITIAAFFMFLTGNTTLSVFIYIALSSIAPVIMELMSSLVIIQKTHADRLTPDGVGNMICADLMLGLPETAVFKLFLGTIVYIGIFVLLTVLFFRKKELDF